MFDSTFFCFILELQKFLIYFEYRFSQIQCIGTYFPSLFSLIFFLCRCADILFWWNFLFLWFVFSLLFLKSLLFKTHMIFFCALFYSLCVLIFKFYFMFKFVIYLKLNFVHDVKQRLRFFVLPMWTWFFSLDLSVCWNILIDFHRLNQPYIWG